MLKLLKAALILLVLVPGNVACASALPFEDELRSRTGRSPVGEVLREVVSSSPAGAACRCEAVCQ